MHSTEKKSERQEVALQTLLSLACFLPGLTADFYYLALLEQDFDREELFRFVGTGMRIGQSRGWIERTGFAIKSKRNKSNTHSLWLSKVYGYYPDGKRIDEALLANERLKWAQVGLAVPTDLLSLHALQTDLLRGKRHPVDVSVSRIAFQGRQAPAQRGELIAPPSAIYRHRSKE